MHVIQRTRIIQDIWGIVRGRLYLEQFPLKIGHLICNTMYSYLSCYLVIQQYITTVCVYMYVFGHDAIYKCICIFYNIVHYMLCVFVYVMCICICYVYLYMLCVFVYVMCICICYVYLYMLCVFVYVMCICICYVYLYMLCVFVYVMCICICYVYLYMLCVFVYVMCICICYVYLYMLCIFVNFYQSACLLTKYKYDKYV